MTVYLTTAEIFPVHCERGPVRENQAPWEQWRGQAIEVFDLPELPNEKWTCGTPKVWRVRRRDSEAITGNANQQTFVCVHQIQPPTGVAK